MQLNNLIIEPRIRNPWAAIDLGTVIARRFWVQGALLYLTLALPFMLIVSPLSQINEWLPYILLWWFKPIFERPFLYCLSRELFSQQTDYWQCLKDVKSWLFPSLISILSLRRLSFNRAMFAPVSLLEQPSFKDYGKRVDVLGSQYSSASTWLTIVLYHFENFIVMGLLTAYALLFPEHLVSSLNWFETLSQDSLYMDIGLVIILAIVAPFYCASGFMLYICRRIELEGWDIEMSFREWILEESKSINDQNRRRDD